MKKKEKLALLNANSNTSSGNILKLNVGGTIFQTSRSTLTKYDCMFRTMLETDIPLQTDSSGCIFIDRDPTHFRLILNFMRDGHVDIPQNSLKEVLIEAQFYLLQGLIDHCNNPPSDFLVINEPSELLEILVKTNKEVLVYKVTTSQGMLDWPYDLKEFRDFVEKYKEKCQVVLMVVTNGCWTQWRVDHYPLKRNKDYYKKFPDFFDR